MADATPSTTTPSATRCGRCQAALNESERVTAGDRVFCRTCYDILKLQLRTGVAAGAKRGGHVRNGLTVCSDVQQPAIVCEFDVASKRTRE